MVTYKDSIFKFTDPIRYFKENDPYYWEVDNIPLKQLQENVLWLKDQLSLIPEEEVFTGVNRSDLNELKPYVDDTGTTVKVKPGRFIARINDAYNKTPLQKIRSVLPDSGLSPTEFNTAYFDDSTLTNYANLFLDKVKNTIAENSLNLNGLSERIMSYDDIIKNSTLSPNQIGFNNGFPNLGDWPHEKLALLVKQFSNDRLRESLSVGNEFIKQFRGVARTAVVDVPEELAIEIPPFDSTDYFWTTPEGGVQYIEGATLRIDLLFVYSKPIDSDSATLNKWNANNPTTILTPQLGLIKGAGVGVRDLGDLNNSFFLNPKNADGNTQILGQSADELNFNNGFKSLNVHGSFPSPDDLLNLAPVIQERLESNDPRLIGQTILPLAYVVVRKNAPVGAGGAPVINSEDVIDIRPFLRTAELAYNERAGLCAAIPSPSLANPVATIYNVEKAKKDLKAYADDTFLTQAVGFNSARIAAAGYVLGGTSYGPEQFLEAAGASIPPGWDKSIVYLKGDTTIDGPFEYADMAIIADTEEIFGGYNANRDGQHGHAIIHRKTIEVTGIGINFQDYVVECSLHNCIRLTGFGVSRIVNGDDDYVDANYGGIYVIKKTPSSNNSIKFTIICISCVIDNFGGQGDPTPAAYNTYPERFKTYLTAGLSVETTPVSSDRRLNQPFSSCVFPSVKYTVYLSPTTLNSYNSDSGNSTIPSLV